MAKRYLWQVFTEGGTATGFWMDAPDPRFTYGIGDGLSSLTVTLPRGPGAFGVLGEGGTAQVSVALGYRVDVLCWDDDTAAAAPELSLWDAALWDAGEWDGGRGLSRLIYRGTVIEYASVIGQRDAGLRVVLAPLARLLEQSKIEDSVTLTGDVCEVARQVVISYAPGLTWDSRNPASAGRSGSWTFGWQSAGDALKRLVEAAGEAWVLYVTPQGSVRFFQPDRTVVNHNLTVGIQASDAEFVYSAVRQRRRVAVSYGTGISSAQTADYSASDPRTELVSSQQTDSGTADVLAAGVLARSAGVELRGRVTVIDSAGRDTSGRGYDIESIAPGDVVLVRALQPGVTGAGPPLWDVATWDASFWGGGGIDYSGGGLVVASVDYAPGSARLELSDRRPDFIGSYLRLAAELTTQTGRV